MMGDFVWFGILIFLVIFGSRFCCLCRWVLMVFFLGVLIIKISGYGCRSWRWSRCGGLVLV